jgi:hypothetical protein
VGLRIHILVPVHDLEVGNWTETEIGSGLSIVDVHLSKLVYRMQLQKLE